MTKGKIHINGLFEGTSQSTGNKLIGYLHRESDKTYIVPKDIPQFEGGVNKVEVFPESVFIHSLLADDIELSKMNRRCSTCKYMADFISTSYKAFVCTASMEIIELVSIKGSREGLAVTSAEKDFSDCTDFEQSKLIAK